MEVGREQVLRYRAAVHGLSGGGGAGDGAGGVLDLGVQDTGPDGAAWAVALRGLDADADGLAHAWTLRGAPHAYRRDDLPDVQVATSPFSDADAAKRVFDAAKPLKAAGIGILDALREVATAMRDIVREPTVKGEVSTRLTQALPEPYRRWCNPCQAIHLFEQPFRLSSLHAGLELEPGTSPPVLRRVPGWPRRRPGPARDPLRAPDRLQPVRAYLHLHGPATAKQVAAYVDSPVKDVTAHWPDDVVEVAVDGRRRSLLADDAALLADPPTAGAAHLLGPFDPLLQTRDRELLVTDDGARKDLWRTLGRPGGVLVDADVVGSWRPRARGKRFAVEVRWWSRPTTTTRRAVEEAAERLADHRGRELAGVTDA